MTRAEEIAAALAHVRARIAEAEARAGRPAGSVALIAVSKKMPLDDVRAALAAGQRDFGENYAQELRDKRDTWTATDGATADSDTARDADTAPRWHYLGPLQKNKVKILAGQVALIHSVEDADVLAEIDRRAAGAGAVQPCLVQVNVAGEAQKHGVPPERLPALLDQFPRARHATCAGLMLIPPLGPDGGDVRRHFAALRTLAEREARVPRAHVQLDALSMGMSGDFTIAIEEGATLVRVGTAIFGSRAVR
jgi:pyridoxal phosphate enzyme (YggS family)